MADRLRGIRKLFVEGVNTSVIKELLDSLCEDEIIKDCEKEMVTENTSVTRDQARCLIDMIIKKGDKASEKFLQALQKEDPTLSTKIGLKQ
ncbi:caspase recruitment domain-containing protein 18 isoform X2 [Xenopus laevis]|uniref:Caspase recruitment domain-containing protein 18 isoform X2 n=1 Tax=Xenopus laevis TaxID=8355 RepID=A0A8J1M8P7_XENLA|nr:caspase recruitment domain-containing protein 18 isoform X2 [Xenopus laevis]XP_041437701.1 caspase recruitment domain-containing protein 18 isoform X2 [Xenopus laevis]